MTRGWADRGDSLTAWLDGLPPRVALPEDDEEPWGEDEEDEDEEDEDDEEDEEPEWLVAPVRVH